MNVQEQLRILEQPVARTDIVDTLIRKRELSPGKSPLYYVAEYFIGMGREEIQEKGNAFEVELGRQQMGSALNPDSDLFRRFLPKVALAHTAICAVLVAANLEQSFWSREFDHIAFMRHHDDAVRGTLYPSLEKNQKPGTPLVEEISQKQTDAWLAIVRNDKTWTGVLRRPKLLPNRVRQYLYDNSYHRNSLPQILKAYEAIASEFIARVIPPKPPA